MGVEFAALFVIIQPCYLWRETSVKRALCVQFQLTLSVIGNVIFLRDSGNRRCELLVVIVRRDHLIQNAFHPLLLLSLLGDRHMYCGITSLMR